MKNILLSPDIVAFNPFRKRPSLSSCLTKYFRYPQHNSFGLNSDKHDWREKIQIEFLVLLRNISSGD